MKTPPPASLSAYRGQSRTGIGEGPGRPISHGEQYLAASAPLDGNASLLREIRSWMSLDADPYDLEQAGDQLEGWSCFSHGGRSYVARMVSAGIYDRRPAYFTHGRAWPADSLAAGFDPGAHLGRSEAFEQPWRDDDPGQRVTVPEPAMVRPEQIKAEEKVAVLFLAHLLQARVESQPLIIAAPVGDFVRESPLHALISFARAALPWQLKDGCQIRVYTRNSEIFLRHLAADLVVVPDAEAADALAARRKATLLDRRGERGSGRELQAQARDYAQAVVERASKLPAGLLLFSQRFGEHGLGPGLPEPEDVRAVQITYNLAFAMLGSEERRGDLLRKYLFKKAGELGPLPWDRLIDDREWQGFPQQALLQSLLRPTDDLGAGGRALQAELENVASRLGLTADSLLDGWWSPDDAAKARRLLELLNHQPPLVSAAAGAERTVSLSIDYIAASGPAAGVLAAEHQAGVLDRRAGEAESLARAARDRDVFEVLGHATSDGALDAEWTRIFIRKGQDEDLRTAADYLLRQPDTWPAWGELPKRLFDRLLDRDLDLASLGPAMAVATEAVESADNLELFLRLAELSVRIHGNTATPTVDKLRLALPGLEDPTSRALVTSFALSSKWRCLGTQSLVDATGRLAVPWADTVAGRLIASDDVLSRLRLGPMLDLGKALEDRDVENLRRIYDEIDRRAGGDGLQAATGALIEKGWWYYWRRETRLDSAAQRPAAHAWLTSPAWRRRPAPETTLEAWELALADLGEVSGSDMAALCGGPAGDGPAWPWIPPFESEQLDVLCRAAADLGALAEIAESVTPERVGLKRDDAMAHYVVERSRLSDTGLPKHALLWLSRLPGERPALTLEDSLRLYRVSGHRHHEALEARATAVLRHLGMTGGAVRALDGAAEEPDLWQQQHPAFLEGLAEWMDGHRSVAAMPEGSAAAIDRHLIAGSIHRIDVPDEVLARDLLSQGLSQAADFLVSGISDRVWNEDLPQKALTALRNGRSEDDCWQDLEHAIQAFRKSETPAGALHPVLPVAEAIRDLRRASEDDLGTLADTGWQTFEVAAAKRQRLFQMDPDRRIGLPALDVAAGLLGDGALGQAALRLVYSPLNRERRTGVEWWRALASSIRRCLRHGRDRQELVFTLLRRAAGDLERRQEIPASSAAHIKRSLRRVHPAGDRR